MNQVSWGLVVAMVVLTVVGFIAGRVYEYKNQDVETLIQTQEEMDQIEFKIRKAMDEITHLETQAKGIEESARNVRRSLQGVRTRRSTTEPESGKSRRESKARSSAATAKS